jgi:DNA-binding transcriptional LysR family regulator
MRFDLMDLRLFVAIVEAGSISRGADAAHLSLASASARVSGMEDALGARLLTRGRRGVVPTAAGRTLLHHARTVSAQIARMRGDLREFAGGLKGEIRMLANTAALVRLLPAALQAFLASHPGIDIHIEEMTSVDIVQAIAEDRAEFAVLADSADTGLLETIPLMTDQLVFVAPAAHPLGDRKTVAFAELLDESFVGLTAGALYDHLAGHALRLGRRLNYRVRLRSFDAVLRLIEAGAGVGILPRAAIDDMRSEALAILPLSDVWAARRLMLCARRFDVLGVHARAMVAEIQLQAGQ